VDLEEEYKKSWWEEIEEIKKKPFDYFVENLTKDLIRGNEVGLFEERWILKVTEGTFKSALMKEIVDKVILYKSNVERSREVEDSLVKDTERLLTASNSSIRRNFVLFIRITLGSRTR
jgi:hypothetical protein